MKKVVPYLTYLGTRPPTLDEWEKYEPHHRARMSFRPGLTGLWQVSGRSNITDFEEVVKLDTPNTTVSYNPNEAHIVYASDDGFAEILGVSMVSLYENSKDMEFIAVYVLDSGITDTNKKKLESICKTYNRSLPVWIKAMNVSQELSMDVAVDRGSLSQYARLFISRDVPADLHRVLYGTLMAMIQLIGQLQSPFASLVKSARDDRKDGPDRNPQKGRTGDLRHGTAVFGGEYQGNTIPKTSKTAP